MVVCVIDKIEDEITIGINKSLSGENQQRRKLNSIVTEIENKKECKRKVTRNNLY